MDHTDNLELVDISKSGSVRSLLPALDKEQDASVPAAVFRSLSSIDPDFTAIVSVIMFYSIPLSLSP